MPGSEVSLEETELRERERGSHSGCFVWALDGASPGLQCSRTSLSCLSQFGLELFLLAANSILLEKTDLFVGLNIF